MKIEMSESLVASWLKHVKHCIVVNTNWKASPYWTPAVPDAQIGQICNAAVAYFNEHGLMILDSPNEPDENEGIGGDGVDVDWQNMLLQTECDVVGVAHSNNQGRQLIYAVESAFHRNKVQYSKQKRSWIPLHLSGAKVTAWNIALKMFKNALSMYRWYGVRDAHIVFVAPKSSEPVENEIISACNHVANFYRQQGFHFDFEFYLEHAIQGASGLFSELVKTPVNLAATIVDDTSELYLRAHILDEDTQSIDVLMLHKARRLLNCENLDEMAGLHLNSPASVVAAIEQIQTLIVTTTDAENHTLYQRQLSLFNRCHGVLRGYYAAIHELDDVPTMTNLRHAAQPRPGAGMGAERGNVVNGARDQHAVEIVLNPAAPVEFKQQLLQTHLARRTRVFADGRAPIVDQWRADSFTANSNLMGNIKSSAAFRNAARDGVTRLEFEIVNN